MAKITHQIDCGHYPDEPEQVEEWDEYDLLNDIPLDNGIRRWMVHFTRAGIPVAQRPGSNLIGFQAFAERWGQWIADEFREKIREAMLGPERDDNDAVISAVEARFEAEHGK